MDASWTIGELEQQVEAALADMPEPPSGQVRAVPDLRTIRYYGTLGLIDRPAEMRGRTALYGRRHLLQLVAIKRLQADGLSLAEIQERLHGLPDAALERIARLAPTPAAAPPRSTAPAPVSAREAFWRRAPVAPSAAAAPPVTAAPAASAPAAAVPAAVEHLVRVELAPGVHLTFPAAPGEVELDLDPDALRRAAAPLLAALRRPTVR